MTANWPHTMVTMATMVNSDIIAWAARFPHPY